MLKTADSKKADWWAQNTSNPSIRAVQFDQLIINAAISCGVTSKPLCILWT